MSEEAHVPEPECLVLLRASLDESHRQMALAREGRWPELVESVQLRKDLLERAMNASGPAPLSPAAAQLLGEIRDLNVAIHEVVAARRRDVMDTLGERRREREARAAYAGPAPRA